MPDYEAMYLTLFRAMTRCVEIMRQAQLEAEEIYMSETEPVIELLNSPRRGVGNPARPADSAARDVFPSRRI